MARELQVSTAPFPHSSTAGLGGYVGKLRQKQHLLAVQRALMLAAVHQAKLNKRATRCMHARAANPGPRVQLQTQLPAHRPANPPTRMSASCCYGLKTQERAPANTPQLKVHRADAGHSGLLK